MKEENNLPAEHLSTLLAQARTLEEADSIAAEAGILAQPHVNSTGALCGQNPPRKIGIWERTQENGDTWYIRTDQKESFGFWSNLERIGPRNGRKRILLLGESVARGICYDPFFTPAMALEQILGSILAEPVEVIDLARSDIGLHELQALIENSLALSPDAIVIFAGNNWRLPMGTVNFDLAEIARKLETAGDWTPITAHVQEEVRSGIQFLLALLQRVIAEKQIPVVFLLPEFNLLDWKNEYSGQMPVANGTELLAWEDWRKQAEESLANGDIARATALAEGIIAVDGGTLPAGYEILARCKMRLGETTAARAFYEQARDASHSLPINLSPRCYSIIQELLRQKTSEWGIRLVDLPELFARFLGDELPGRKLFLDYCHMSSEGIRLAMAAAAQELYSCLANSKPTGQEAFSVPVSLDKTTEAHAHFLAAIHNARCGQEYEIVRHHCDAALEQDSAIHETMLLYLQATLESAPLFMSKSFWQMPKRSRDAISWSLRSLNRECDVNLVLVNAIADAVAGVTPEIRDCVGDLLHREFCLKDQATNLLTKPFCNPASFQPERDWEGRTINFRAFSRHSSFWFIGAVDCETQISMSYRAAGATSESGQVRVFANDQLVHVCPASPVWRDTTFVVASDLAAQGPVKLVIKWPDPTWTREQRIAELVHHLQQGPIEGALLSFPESFAAFGEIQLLAARSCAQFTIGTCLDLPDQVTLESQA
jgi:hypothetical protein